MRFKGQLLLPGESGPGLKVNLDVAEHHLAVESDGGGLGAWPLEVVDVERLQGDLYGLTVAGEPLRFVADDTIAFAYSAVPAIEQVVGRSRSRSGVRSMIGRLWKAPDAPATVEPSPVTEGPPAENPPLTSDIFDRDAVDTQPNVPQEIVLDEPVARTPIPAPRPPTPEPPTEALATPEPATAPDDASEVAQCPAVRTDGRRCESQILTDSGYCYPHSPKRAFEDGYEAAQEARAQLKKDATARLNRIYGRLDKAMRQVERGELDPETAMAMAQLAKTMCAILQIDETASDTGSQPPQS